MKIQQIKFEVLGKQHTKYSFKTLTTEFIVSQIKQISKTAHLVEVSEIDFDSIDETMFNENDFSDISKWFLDIRVRFDDKEAVK